MELFQESVAAGATRGLRIPRVIHRIWLGDAPLPAEAVEFGETWARHHPEWELRLWRDADLPPLRHQDLFDRATSLAERADIARYELLLRFGGVYVDTDFECLRPLEPLLDDVTAFLATEDGRNLSIGIIGAVPGHPFLQAVVAALPASIAERGARPPNQVTGPGLVTALAEGDPELRAGLRVFAAELFYPYLYNEPYRRHDAFPDAYAVHHWAASWVDHEIPTVPARWRLVVATDWSEPAAALAVLRPFAELYGPQDRIELVFAVPHEPGAGDLEQALELFHSLGIDPERCAPLSVESFGDAADTRYDVALVPAGSPDLLLLEVGAAVSWLHATRRLLERHGRPALAATYGHATVSGSQVQLAQRLAGFRAAGAQPPPATPASPVAVPGGHRATYVGGDRLLVSTTWGGKLFMAASDLSLTPEVVHDGNYDEPFTRFLQRTLRPGDVAFDVGANVGLFTLLMARLVGGSGRVVAYEAAPGNVALLRDNVAMNYLTGWVDVVAKAAAASAGSVPFFCTTRFRGNGSTIAHDAAYHQQFAVDGQERIEVDAEPLDVHHGRFPAIRLVKIDVEGGEEQVFAGMTALLASGTVERVCFELLRERLAGHWEPHAARLRALVAAGWSVATLDAEGALVPQDIEHILAVGAFPQVVLGRPGISTG